MEGVAKSKPAGSLSILCEFFRAAILRCHDVYETYLLSARLAAVEAFLACFVLILSIVKSAARTPTFSQVQYDCNRLRLNFGCCECTPKAQPISLELWNETQFDGAGGQVVV